MFDVFVWFHEILWDYSFPPYTITWFPHLFFSLGSSYESSQYGNEKTVEIASSGSS